MADREIELQGVEPGQQGRYMAVGWDGIDRIVMRNDGCGLTGYYDVIYVYAGGEIVCAMPAHNCIKWNYTINSHRNET